MLEVRVAGSTGTLDYDVTLAVKPGTCLALTGPSGAGKTTILRAVAGLARPRSGRISHNGDVWLDTKRGINLAPERRAVGYVFQDYALFEHLSALENVAYPLARRPRARRRARAHELLERFGLGARAAARPRELSGGERQRVALARALARDPAVLALDEPLSALDPQTRGAAARELANVLDGADVPTLLVTHDFAQAALLGQEVAVLCDGAIAQRGTPAALAAAPASAFVAELTGAVVLRGRACRPDADGLTRVSLDGGASVVSVEPGDGAVAVTLFPWDIALAPAGSRTGGSARNQLPAQVVSVTEIGGRVRVGLDAGQAFVAEVTAASAAELGLRPGLPVIAAWKAAATRLIAR